MQSTINIQKWNVIEANDDYLQKNGMKDYLNFSIHAR